VEGMEERKDGRLKGCPGDGRMSRRDPVIDRGIGQSKDVPDTARERRTLPPSLRDGPHLPVSQALRARLLSLGPYGTVHTFPLSRHFVPGYYHWVPTGRSTLSRFPDTSCQATFTKSLRDGPLFPVSQALRARLPSLGPYGTVHTFPLSRHFVPGYFHWVPPGHPSTLSSAPPLPSPTQAHRSCFRWICFARTGKDRT
jgi:hypothetical protein